MTIIETLPTTFSGGNSAALPAYKLDPMIEAGSMFLIEPALSWNAGIPANNTLISNLAASKLAKRGYNTDMTWVMDPEANNGVNGKLERSAKGGLHQIASRNAPIAQDKGAAVLFPAWFADYIVANPTHEFGWSIWQRPTRAYAGAGSIITSAMANNNVTAGGIAAAPYLGISAGNPVDVVNRVVKSAIPSAPDAAAMKTERARHAMAFFRRSISNRDHVADLPSYIIYRVTMEDLTVSGRTYSAFSAADLVEYNAAFAAGGRYAGDTWTNPLTFLP
jgi:hypothetical protein